MRALGEQTPSPILLRPGRCQVRVFLTLIIPPSVLSPDFVWGHGDTVGYSVFGPMDCEPMIRSPRATSSISQSDFHFSVGYNSGTRLWIEVLAVSHN